MPYLVFILSNEEQPMQFGNYTDILIDFLDKTGYFSSNNFSLVIPSFFKRFLI